jgi:transcription elongation GreA/GreB family factor
MHVVGSEEADMAQGKISHRSPLGNALLGKKKDDSVSVKSPNGTATYTIIAIE